MFVIRYVGFSDLGRVRVGIIYFLVFDFRFRACCLNVVGILVEILVGLWGRGMGGEMVKFVGFLFFSGFFVIFFRVFIICFLVFRNLGFVFKILKIYRSLFKVVIGEGVVVCFVVCSF